MANAVTFTLPGTPTNWSNARFRHWAAGYSAKKRWLDATVEAGKQARIKANWNVCPAEQRVVEIRCFRIQLMDHDGATSSIKPILDGLKVKLKQREKQLRRYLEYPGAGLIFDDHPDFVDLVSPGSLQVKVDHLREQRTEVTVRLY